MCFWPGALIEILGVLLLGYPLWALSAMLGIALAQRATAKLNGPHWIVWLVVWLAAGLTSMLPIMIVLTGGVVSDRLLHGINDLNYRQIYLLPLSLLSVGAVFGLICGSIYELVLRLRSFTPRT
jgi:disulfide bond formation protein DsbB